MGKIVIIGGGPAGMMAAISASGKGSEVILLEKNLTLGRKILVSGNGKCNLTNSNLDISKYHGNRHFLKSVFGQFDNIKLMKFFEELGVKLHEDDAGRVWPATKHALTILDALIDELNWKKVKVLCNESVISIRQNKLFEVRTLSSTHSADKIILSVGGCSYPQLGSSKEGYTLAKSFGHKIIEPHQAMVPVELSENWFHKLQGVKADVEINIKTKERHYKYKGELLFTNYGISGPVVLNASRIILDYYKNPDTEISINFLPEYNQESMGIFLDNMWKTRPARSLVNSFCGILPRKLAAVLLSLMNTGDITRHVSQVSKKEQRKIIENLMKWDIKVKGSRPFTEAMVTAGGVDTSEVNPLTIESKLAKGLFLAGEILDVDAESGGFNLQFAFSTGWLAGKSAVIL